MIDYTFVQKLEGSNRHAVVPRVDDGPMLSGVTIGGVDLGYWPMNSLKAYGVAPELARKLLPYIGLRGDVAESYLRINPLFLMDEEYYNLCGSVYRQITDHCIKAYHKSSLIRFWELSDEIQTVIFSVYLQYGNLAVRTPNFWRQVTTGDWEGALANLRDFGDAYPTRRHKEANLFEQGLVKLKRVRLWQAKTQ